MLFVPVNSDTPLHQYIAGSNQTEYTFTFTIYHTSNVKVFLNHEEIITFTVKKSDGTSITNDDLIYGLAGGKVILNDAPEESSSITITRDIPIERSSGFTTSGALNASTLNTEINRILEILKQQKRDLDRTIRKVESDAASGSLQIPVNNANKYLGFDSEGNMVAVEGTQQNTVDTYNPTSITIQQSKTDAVNDIDFSSGSFISDDYSTTARLSALTKRIDSTWQQGTNNGGLDTGELEQDAFYHCFVIYNPSTVITDCLFSKSKTEPTLPTGYTKKRRIGTFYRSTANTPFVQYGSTFYTIINSAEYNDVPPLEIETLTLNQLPFAEAKAIVLIQIGENTKHILHILTNEEKEVSHYVDNDVYIIQSYGEGVNIEHSMNYEEEQTVTVSVIGWIDGEL